MLDLQTPDTTTEELTPEQKIQQRLNRLTHINVGSLVWQLVPQSGKDGYYAGRKHHRELERMDLNEWDRLYHDQGKAIGDTPLPCEMADYLDYVRPPEYTGENAEEWERYFVAGFYSRVFKIDCY